MATPRKATTTRTPAARKKVGKIVDFDAARAKGKKKAVATLRAYGQDWPVKQPNQVLVGELMKSDDLSSMIDYLLAHIEASRRDDFLMALSKDENLDMDAVMLLAEKLTEGAYADLPT